MKHIHDTVKRAKDMRLDRSQALEDAYYYCSAKEQRYKMTPNDILLYPQIGESLNSHHRSFFLPWIIVSPKTSKCTMCRE